MKNTAYKSLGFVFLGLALLGVVLPVLPTTPFLLLAAWFFSRSSEKWHQWLLQSELFGGTIRNWEENRCISCRTKIVSLILMLGMGGTSIFLVVDDRVIQWSAGLFVALGCVTLLSIRTCPGKAKTPAST